MKKLMFILISALFSLPLPAQHVPSYRGGETAMNAYFQANLNYPEMAQENAIEGTVLLRLKIDTDGRVATADVVKGIGFGCDEEARRLALGMPHWQPAEKEKEQVVSHIYLRVGFRLQ